MLERGECRETAAGCKVTRGGAAPGRGAAQERVLRRRRRGVREHYICIARMWNGVKGEAIPTGPSRSSAWLGAGPAQRLSFSVRSCAACPGRLLLAKGLSAPIMENGRGAAFLNISTVGGTLPPRQGNPASDKSSRTRPRNCQAIRQSLPVRLVGVNQACQ